MTTSDIPLADQIAEVKREIAMRERVYPKWVAAGKLKAETANRKTDAMRAVLATLTMIDDVNKECGR